MKRSTRALLLGILACSFLALSACNTTKGFGRDVEKGGEALQRSADKHGAD